VAESTLRNTAIPVLITGPECQLHLRLFRSILFATALEEPYAALACNYGANLARQHDGKFTLLHVIREKAGTAHHQRARCEQEARRHLIQLLCLEDRVAARAEVHIAYGKPHQEILATAEALNASLIVLGLAERSSWDCHKPWSELSALLAQSRCPVLVLRPNSAGPSSRLPEVPPTTIKEHLQ